MRNWGTCHVEVCKELLSWMLTMKGWQLIVHEAKWTGETLSCGDIYYVNLGSPLLEKGYHGMMNFVILDPNNYKLKKDQDT